MHRFFEEGDKVKVTLRFRGRELAHPELGMKLLQQVKIDFEPVAKVEYEPRMEGKQMIMILAPNSQGPRIRGICGDRAIEIQRAPKGCPANRRSLSAHL